ncbi:MAG: hypothetical protein WC713_04160 [Candidatus Methylomirabilota bacterium]
MEEQQIEKVEKDSTGISTYVTDLFQEFRNGRRPYEDKAEEWWNNFLSQYQSTKVWRNKEGEGKRSRIFIKVTQQKCYTAHAKVMDALGSDIPFELGALENLSYGEIPPEAIEEAARFRRNYIADYLKYIKFFDTLDDSVLDATIFPAAIIKGPILVTDKQPVVQRRMIAGIPAEQLDATMSPFMVTIESVEKYIFETVPFWDYYVDVNSKNTRKSIGEIQYKRMLPQEFRELKDDPGYDQDQMALAIANIDLLKNDFPDMDKDKTAKQAGDKFMGFEVIKDSKIPVIEFHGLIRADLLRAFGSDVPENISDSEDCEACIAMVDDGTGTVIKARYNYYGYRPFMVFGVKKIPNSVYKNSIAGLMDDSQSMINSGARLFIDGKALAGNGCIAVHDDKINWPKTGAATFYPGKTYYLKGNASIRDAIENLTFQDVTLGIKDMVQMFMQIADEETGIPKYSQGDGNASSYLNKMLDINTPVPMANGSYKLLSDIVDGDMILGSDGLPTRVVSAHKIHLPLKAYRIKFNSGEEIVAGGEHLWSVMTTTGAPSIKNTDTLFGLKGKWFIPRVHRPMFSSNERLPLDPYLLGLWLGDGHSYSSRITTSDPEIVEYIKEWSYRNGGGVSIDKIQNSGKALTYSIRGKEKERNPATGQYQLNSETLFGRLRNMGLMRRSEDKITKPGKHIPSEYLKASYQDRLELLRGLMDTDGCHHSNNLSIFIQKEGRLVNDVVKLIESLGGWPRVHEVHPERAENSWAKPGVKYYQIHFSIFDNPFKLKKKADKWRPMIRKVDKNKIVSIEPTEICKMRCLTVDAKDGLFCVGERFTVTHNTATGISMIMGAANVNLKPFLKNIDDNVIEPVVERLDALFSMLGKYPPQMNLPLKISATGTISMMARELIVENMIKLLQITQNPQDSMILRRRELLLAMAEKLGLSKFVKSEQEIQKIEQMMAERQASQPIQAEGGVAVDKLFPSLTPFEQAQILKSVGLQPDPRRMQGMVPEQIAPPPEAQAPYDPNIPQPQPGGPQ